MSNHRMGATLYELLITISVLGIALSIALPTLRSAIDGLAVRAARESAFALFSRARVAALEYGGAEIRIDAARDYISVHSHDGALEREQFFAETDLVAEGTQPIVLRYDAHGLGRMMSRTVAFRVRTASAGLTISSFGRVRRW